METAPKPPSEMEVFRHPELYPELAKEYGITDKTLIPESETIRRFGGTVGAYGQRTITMDDEGKPVIVVNKTKIGD